MQEFVSIDGICFDISDFKHRHPGGKHLLEAMNKQDVTDLFEAFHKPNSKSTKILKTLPVLLQKPRKTKVTTMKQDFEDLKQEIQKRGLYQTKYRPYAVLFVTLFVLWNLSFYFLLQYQDYFGTILSAGLFALFLQQCAFIGHDAGHSAITHNLSHDFALGLLVGPLCTGVSISWWRYTHFLHHVSTNVLDRDCDVQHLPFLAISSDFFKRGGFYSYYHASAVRFTALHRFLVSRQHILFYPLMFFARWNLYAQSFSFVLSHAHVKEFFCLLGYWASIWVFLSQVNDSYRVFVWLLLSNGLAGILHVQITASHFSMDTMMEQNQKTETKSATTTFLQHQLATTMDIETTWWSGWFFGGLQYQVCHHIFPRVARHHLPEATELLMIFCAKHHLAYTRVSFPEANHRILRRLAMVAAEAKTTETWNDAHDILWNAINAQG